RLRRMAPPSSARRESTTLSSRPAHQGQRTWEKLLPGPRSGATPLPAAAERAASGLGGMGPAGEPCPLGAAERVRRLLGVIRVLGGRVDRPPAPRRGEDGAPVHAGRRRERVLARVVASAVPV